MLDDEEEALAAADMQSQVAAEEAARAVRRAQAKGDGSMDERVARLQQRAKAASERAAALRLVIEGPQPPEVRPPRQLWSTQLGLGSVLSYRLLLQRYGHIPAVARLLDSQAGRKLTSHENVACLKSTMSAIQQHCIQGVQMICTGYLSMSLLVAISLSMCLFLTVSLHTAWRANGGGKDSAVRCPGNHGLRHHLWGILRGCPAHAAGAAAGRCLSAGHRPPGPPVHRAAQMPAH